MSDRTDKIMAVIATIAWYGVCLGAIVAVWEGNDVTQGGGIAATAAIVWGFIFVHAAVVAAIES